MHRPTCTCASCRAQQAESYEVPLNEADEVELALELLDVSSEAELDQFLGKLVKGAWKGLKKVGSAIGKVAKPLGGVLRSVAKTALPFVGGALGSFIPIPGVGTALGRAVGTAVSKALELEMEGVSLEDREFEMARRFVRLATTAAQRAATSPPGVSPDVAVRNAVVQAARTHLPHADLRRFGVPASQASGSGGRSGRWVRQGQQITLLGI